MLTYKASQPGKPLAKGLDMSKDNVSWYFFLVDKTGCEYDLKTGDEFIQVYDIWNYDYEKFTLKLAVQELKNDCEKNGKVLGKDFFIKKITLDYFDHELAVTTHKQVSTYFVNEKYVWDRV